MEKKMLHRSKTSKIVKAMCLSLTLIQLLSSPLMADRADKIFEENNTLNSSNLSIKNFDVDDYNKKFENGVKLNIKHFENLTINDFKQKTTDWACAFLSALYAIQQTPNLHKDFEKKVLKNIAKIEGDYYLKLPSGVIKITQSDLDSEGEGEGKNYFDKKFHPSKSSLLRILGHYILNQRAFYKDSYDSSYDLVNYFKITNTDYFFNKPVKVIGDGDTDFVDLKGDGTLVYDGITYKDFFISASFGTGHAYSIFFKDNKWLVFDNQDGETFGENNFVEFYQEKLKNLKSRAQSKTTGELEKYVSLKLDGSILLDKYNLGLSMYDAYYEVLFKASLKKLLNQVQFTLIGNLADSNQNDEVS